MRRTAVVAFAMISLLTGCSGGSDDRPTATLLDGDSAREVPVRLDGVDGPTVLTSARVVPTASIQAGSPPGICLRTGFAGRETAESAVVRVGVRSESVTFEDVSGRAVFGCNDSPGPRDDDRRWCGGGYGELSSGKLDDPRLDIICQTSEGRQVGFAWIEPDESVRYVAVEQPDYTEVYEPVGGLPVRIFTLSGVDLDTSSATFDVSEHDAQGKRLREYELKAAVAG